MKRIVRIPRIVGLFGAVWSTSLFSVPLAFGDCWGCCSKGSSGPAIPVGPPIPVTPTAANGGTMSSFYGNFGPNPPSAGTFLPAGLPQTSPAFFPTAAYDTQWQRTPVTYYRPVTQFDPNYGTTVTSLQPCTSYQFQAQRVPLVAPAVVGANQWPAVNSPGYFPTALAPAATTFPTLQQVPTAGMPFTANMPYHANAGSSSGPASTLPLATMSSPSGVAPAVYMNQTAPQVSNATAWMPSNSMLPAQVTQMPQGMQMQGTMAMPGMSGLQNCPNGICPPGTMPSGSITSGMIPSIPGAASVVPMGPPTLVPVPNTGNWNSSPASGVQQTLGTMPLPSTSGNLGTPGNGGSVMPNPGDTNPVLPPGAYDSEATRQPSLGPSAGTQTNPYSSNTAGGNVATMFPLKRVPVAELDRSTMTAGAVDNSNPFVEHASGGGVSGPSIPQVLPPMPLKPLQAPSDFDAKPRWNPKLTPVPKSPKPNAASNETVAARVSMWTQPLS